MTFRRCLAASLIALLPRLLSGAQAPASAAPAAGGSAADSLNLRFANGIVAVAEDKVITVADVNREIMPLVAGLQRDARNQQDFDQKLQQLEDSVIQELIDRVLIIKEFKKDEKKHIPQAFVDNRIADTLSDQFDNDRSKFLAYLRSRGQTIREYRKEVEEDIIYHYMQGQQRKSQSIVSPVRIETFYKENKDRFYQEDAVHLRLIQLSRGDDDTDATLLTKGNDLLAKMKDGAKFEDLAKEYSKDTRRSKGGDWGWMPRSNLKEEFSKPVFSMKKGECSQPIVLPEGCYLLFVEDRKYAGIKPIDEARDEIERILIQQMTHANQERWLERLRRNGYIKHY
ncbi:MAG: peptidyl-prolyl cis-trans isomerase [Verrucomicrobia bacterium]|nr:peptidyl-prolyl cis-trans isomerase [Verrucomicrobiota bacterium]